MDPIGIRTFRPLALDAYRVAWVPDHGRVRRNVMNDHGIGADLGPTPDVDRAKKPSAGPDRDVVLHGGVPLAGCKPGPPEGHALIDRDVIADLSGLADHHAHAVVDQKPFADLCRWMDLHTGHGARDRSDQARN